MSENSKDTKLYLFVLTLKKYDSEKDSSLMSTFVGRVITDDPEVVGKEIAKATREWQEEGFELMDVSITHMTKDEVRRLFDSELSAIAEQVKGAWIRTVWVDCEKVDLVEREEILSIINKHRE